MFLGRAGTARFLGGVPNRDSVALHDTLRRPLSLDPDQTGAAKHSVPALPAFDAATLACSGFRYRDILPAFESCSWPISETTSAVVQISRRQKPSHRRKG